MLKKYIYKENILCSIYKMNLDKLIANDKKTFEEKLKGHEFVPLSELKSGDAVRYVKREYNSKNLKCVFCFIDSCEELQPVSVHGYVPYGSDEPPRSWVLSLASLPYTRFYRKKKEEKKSGDSSVKDFFDSNDKQKKTT